MSDDSIEMSQATLIVVASLLVLSIVLAAVVLTLIAPGVVPPGVQGILNRLFALDTVQSFWYMTRAAGLTAYLLLWLSTVWGLAVSSKVFDPLLNRVFSYDFHQFLSLLSIGFILVHVGVLLADHYLPFSVVQILVPFTASYRPVWVGIGIIAFYMVLLVSVTFYIRGRIGHKAFKTIHYVSYLAYGLAVIHGLFAGTDSPLVATQLMYVGTALVVVFLTVYHILMKLPVGGREQTPRQTTPLEKKTM